MPLDDLRPIVAWQYREAENHYRRRIAEIAGQRDRVWRDLRYSSLDAYRISSGSHRARLAKMLGVVDLPPTEYDRMAIERDSVQVEDIPVWLQHDFSARALVFTPSGGEIRAAVIAIPDADQTAQEFAGILEGQSLHRGYWPCCATTSRWPFLSSCSELTIVHFASNWAEPEVPRTSGEFWRNWVSLWDAP